MDVKQKLADTAKITDIKLDVYWDKEINKNFGFNNNQKELIKRLLLHAKEHNLREAKRLRASFIYYAYILGNNKVDEEIYKAAMAVEIVHTALLMHDDVMDKDVLRRGKPTTHVLFENGDRHHGESLAYCLGDSLMALGYELLLEANFPNETLKPALTKLLRGITYTTYGQAYDVALEKFQNWTEDDVIALHKAKTAIYTYENPLIIGGLLGGLDKEVLDILSKYSLDGGVAFQLQDDILGIFGNPEKTGKSADSDLIQGKRTLLILKTLELGTEVHKQNILAAWNNPDANRKQIESAKEAIIESGSLDYSKKVSKDYATKAVETAEGLRKLNLNEEGIDYIQGIAKYMVEREL